MPFEVITCPLSACFLGMSSTQADVARSLRLSDARQAEFDRDDARAAYNVLAGPSQTGDGEPSFFDRMFRRVGRSPLSRGRAEATSTLFLTALRDAGVLEGEVPALTTARDEEFHGELSPRPLAALCAAASADGFDECAVEARIARVVAAIERGDTPSPRARARPPNLSLDGETVIYLPATLTRVLHGTPHDVGSTVGLTSEIAALTRALDAGAEVQGALAPLFATFEVLRVASRVAEAHGRVVVVTR